MDARHLRYPLIALRRLVVLPPWVRRMDARAARSINRHHNLSWLDRGLVRLSRSADRGKLWLVIAIALFVLGGSRRRAAVRGAASLGAASIIANLIGKRIFGGDRPLLKDIPIGRQLKKSPTSPSFPSGHTASAAGFVTGLALESRRSGAVVAPLGAAVAYSRLHTGAHWLSDVLGGAALGVVVAVVGKFVFPVPGKVESAAQSPTIGLPALADGTGTLILVNPSSGIDPRRSDPVGELSEAFPAADIRTLDDGVDIEEIVTAATASVDPPRALGIWGGDGSVAVAADAARRARLPLLVFPGGTFNNFARTTGAGTVEAAIDAARSGSGRRVDVAELDLDDGSRMTVLNAASVGIYPDFVAERGKHEKRLGKPVAALVAAVRVLARANPIEVVIDGRTRRVWSLSIGAGGNSSTTMVPLQRRRLDDGVLDVRVLHARGRFPRMRGIVALAFGRRASAVLDRLPRRPGIGTIEAFTTGEIRLVVHGRGGEAPGFAHDGEVSAPDARESDGGYSATLRIVPRTLDVYSPDGTIT